MTLTEDEKPVAEVLLRAWQKEKEIARLQCTISAMADALSNIGKALSEEVADSGEGYVRYAMGNKNAFTTHGVNTGYMSGSPPTFQLPTAEELMAVITQYRKAQEDLERYEQQKARL